MLLTDGYVESGEAAAKKEGGPRLEERMASHLYSLAKQLRYVRYKAAQIPHVPEPVHIWILGKEGWTREKGTGLAPALRSDEADNYRVMIAGIGPAKSGDPSLVSFRSWTKQAGMVRKKPHKGDSYHAFKSASLALLEQMHSHYTRGCNPGEVLDSLGVPYAFCGDEKTSSLD